MSRFLRVVAVVTIRVSVVGFLLALWSGGLTIALQRLLGAIGLVSGGEEATSYPLGAWTLLIYVAGGTAGFFVRRHPLGSAAALVPLGVVALIYGGPITKAYGAILVVIGIALAAYAFYQSAAQRKTKEPFASSDRT